jgi:undecaprenyl-diphosphatase
VAIKLTDRRSVRLGEVIAVIGGALLLAGSWAIVAARDHVPRFEARVFDALNGLPSFLWPIVWAPMQFGSFVASLVVPLVVVLVSRDWRLGAATLLAAQVAFWASKSVKRVVLRGRPNALLTDVHLHDHAAGLGYVSGHTAVAFALCASIGPSLPRRWWWLAIGLPVLVAFARIYSGAHLPLDVVGGAGLGLLAGTLSRWVFGLGGEGLEPTARL